MSQQEENVSINWEPSDYNISSSFSEMKYVTNLKEIGKQYQKKTLIWRKNYADKN